MACKTSIWATVLVLGAAVVHSKALQRRNDDIAFITDHEFNNITLFAHYAGSAYCNSESSVGRKITCAKSVCTLVEQAEATIVKSFHLKTDVEGYVGVDPMRGLAVVAITGSNSVYDWFHNLNFVQKVPPAPLHGLIHAGFYKQFADARDTIETALEYVMKQHPNYHCIVTGHSLGGAVATITVAYLRARGYQCDLYTYGSPRAGDDTFVEFLVNQPGSEFRATHGRDPTPRLPPSCFNFKHTSPEYYWEGNIFSREKCKVCLGTNPVGCIRDKFGAKISDHKNMFGRISGCSKKKNINRKRDLDMTEEEEELWRLVNTCPAWSGSIDANTGNGGDVDPSSGPTFSLVEIGDGHS